MKIIAKTMGMPETVQKLHKESNQDLIDDEVEAIDNYDRAIDGSDNPEAIETYEHIKDEEQEHIAELEGLDKMMADDITSEQAWEDFKAGYSDFEEKHIGKGRDGDKASLEEKIDVLSAKISELNTDMSRLTDSVPQALGTIEEGKTLEEEVEEEQEGDMLGEEEDDYLGDDFFGDGGDEELGDDFGAEGGEEVTDEDGDSESEDSDDGDMVAEDLEEGEEVVEDDADDAESDGGDEDAEVSDEESDDTEETDDSADESDDDDFIPMDDLMDDDDEEEKDEVIDKMVRVLEKMDKRITHLEHENAGLKKQLSQRMTVQTEPRNLAKSRPTPNTNLRLVKGSYNRPPVSTQYVANQRDIGSGVKKESSSNTSVFRQGLNEVFENCERIANQTH